MTVENKTEDLEAILPVTGKLEVEGIPCKIRRLKSREFLQLVRVLTTGLGSSMQDFDLTGDESEVQGKMLALMLMAIPEAHEEFGDFVFSVVDPENKSDSAELRKALDNPEIEVLVDVLTIVAAQEAPDFRSLVGKLKAALKIVQTAYRPTGK